MTLIRNWWYNGNNTKYINNRRHISSEVLDLPFVKQNVDQGSQYNFRLICYSKGWRIALGSTGVYIMCNNHKQYIDVIENCIP